MRNLHLIWLVNESSLADEDAANLELWKQLNQDFTVKLWHLNDLSDFIDRFYPWAGPAWYEIIAEYWRDGKKSHLAKLSDFARYLLIYHTHSEGQEWNCYADIDMKPVRSISDFIDDQMLIGENVKSTMVIPKGVTKRKIDYSRVDFLVSGENFNARPGSKLQSTNAFILTRPGHPFWRDMTKRGIRNRKNNVLKSFGTWALSDEMHRQKNTILAIHVPFHYWNFCPTQMECPPPPWCCALHRNAISWKDDSLKHPWLA